MKIQEKTLRDLFPEWEVHDESDPYDADYPRWELRHGDWTLTLGMFYVLDKETGTYPRRGFVTLCHREEEVLRKATKVAGEQATHARALREFLSTRILGTNAATLLGLDKTVIAEALDDYDR